MNNKFDLSDNKKVFTRNAVDVIAKEKERLKIQDKKDPSGLAISGGGVRSASFGLGVMQALVENNLLEKIDYMSTVSGGGYIGAALTWALNRVPDAGTKKGKFSIRFKKTIKSQKGISPQ
jgi:predicted acylesterase/phospholipase RssA